MPIPNAMIGLGAIANAIGNELGRRRDEKHAEEVKQSNLVTSLVTAGIQSGTIANPEEAFQWLIAQHGGGKGSKGRSSGKSGGQDGGLPPPLKMLIQSVQQAGGQPEAQPSQQTLGGQDVPTFPGKPEAPQVDNAPRFRSAEDMLRARGAIEAETAGKTTEANFDAKIRLVRKGVEQGIFKSMDEGFERFGMKEQAIKPPVAEKDLQPDKSSPTGWSRRYLNSEGQVVRTEPAPPTSQVTKAGSPAEFFKQREEELGHPLSGEELLKARNDFAKAGQAETPEQRAAMMRAMVDYRVAANKAANTPKDGSFGADVTTTSTGRKYIDLSTYDIKSRQGARDWANSNGVTPVSKEQANALVSVDTARSNMVDMKDMILGKLPKDATGRPIGGAQNKLAQFFQTDADLAAWGSWRESAIQQVRAMQGVGSGQYRLTQQMVNLIINNDIPMLTDTVDTANRKFDTVTRQLNNVENSITIRDRTTLQKTGALSSGGEGGTPKAVQDVLKAKGKGKYKLADGTFWMKGTDGAISPITQAEYDK